MGRTGQADRLEYADTAKRFEFSTMAYGSAAGLAKAVGNLVQIGVDRIFEHNQSLGDALIQGLEERSAQIISPWGDDARSSIVAARFPGHDPADVARSLGQANVLVSLRKDFIRFPRDSIMTPTTSRRRSRVSTGFWVEWAHGDSGGTRYRPNKPNIEM